jgi:predicted MFS family arabinose efflux permease
MYLALNGGNYNKPPWTAAVSGDSFSNAARGYEGEYYVIDSGNARLLSFDEDGVFRWDAAPGSALRQVAAAQSGEVYVTSYGFNDSERIIQADILVYSRRGRRIGVLLSQRYEGEDPELPMYTSGYLGLVVEAQWLYYMEKHPSDLTLYRLDTGLKAPVPEILTVFPYPDAEALILAAACDPQTGAVYIADKFGDLRALSADGAHKALAYRRDEGDGFSLPYGLCVSEGVLYISDIGQRRLYRWQGDRCALAADLGGGAAIEADPRLYYWINGTPEGQVLLISRYDVRAYGDQGLETLGTVFAFDGEKRLSLWLWRILAGLLALGALILAGRLFIYVCRTVGTERVMSSMIVVIVATVVTALVMMQYSDSFNRRFSSATIDNLSALSAMTAAAIDGDALSRIDSLEDYRNEDYETLKKQLTPIHGNNVPNMFYENETFYPDVAQWDQGIYRMLLRVVNGRICYVYSSADQWGALYPVDYSYEETEYQIAYEQKVQIVFPSVVDYSGEYTYTITPVLDSRGAVVGVLEMGVDLRAFRAEMFELLREIALRAAVTVFVVLLLLKEIIFAAEVFKNRTPGRRGAVRTWFRRSLTSAFVFLTRKDMKAASYRAPAPEGEKCLVDVGAVRPLMFLLYVLDSLALVISPLFARSLYTETLGIPMEVGVAIAYSATFFFLGAAAIGGGWAGERLGLFPLLLLGTALIFGGELVAMFSGNLWMFVVAKSLTGMGAGLIQNCADVIAAARKDPKEVEYGFSMSNVGYSSGTNCGLVIGTAIGLLWGYRSVYLASALIAVLMLAYILLIYQEANLPDARGVRGRIGAGFIRFAASPRVLKFFLFIMFPYMLCNAFAYYFLPLTGAAYGMGEENISRIIFAYGMVAVYIGPALTRALLDMFKVRAALVMGGFLTALALLVYALRPDLTLLMVSTAMFAIADSFSFTTQSVYFSQLPETGEYGPNVAMGVNNVVSGLAQSLSSYCFAAAMVLGTRAGLGIIGLGMAVLLILFVFTTYDPKKLKAGVS